MPAITKMNLRDVSLSRRWRAGAPGYPATRGIWNTDLNHVPRNRHGAHQPDPGPCLDGAAISEARRRSAGRRGDARRPSHDLRLLARRRAELSTQGRGRVCAASTRQTVEAAQGRGVVSRELSARVEPYEFSDGGNLAEVCR